MKKLLSIILAGTVAFNSGICKNVFNERICEAVITGGNLRTEDTKKEKKTGRNNDLVLSIPAFYEDGINVSVFEENVEKKDEKVLSKLWFVIKNILYNAAAAYVTVISSQLLMQKCPLIKNFVNNNVNFFDEKIEKAHQVFNDFEGKHPKLIDKLNKSKEFVNNYSTALLNYFKTMFSGE